MDTSESTKTEHAEAWIGEELLEKLKTVAGNSADYGTDMAADAIRVLGANCTQETVYNGLLWVAFSENSHEPESARALAIASLRGAIDIPYVKKHVLEKGLHSSIEPVARASADILAHSLDHDVESRFYTLLTTNHAYAPVVLKELAKVAKEKKKRAETVELLAEAMKAAGQA